jgi:AraC-like DNA-binding protein
MGAPGATAQSLRPEWLFEVVNRLQQFVASPGEPCVPLTADKVFEAFPPESDLEHELRRNLLARLKAEEPIWAARQAAHQIAPSDVCRELSPESTRVDAAVEKAQQLIRRNFATHWTVEALARRVGCNRTDLEVGFRRRYSHTVHRYLIICRVDAAKGLLRKTAWRIEEVAKSVGCRSKVSLYEQFRRALSMTPDEYRRRWTQVAPSDQLQGLLVRTSPQ